MGKLNKLKGAIDQALDMSREARMQRAQDMGFDTNTVYYHGTDKDFDAFDPSRATGTQYWSTTDKAAIEAGDVGAEGSGVIKELYANVANPAGWDEYERFGIDELVAQGYDGVKLPEDGQTTLIAFKPEQYRSVNAAFDQAKKDSADLLASVGGAAVLGGAALSPEQAQASTRLSDFAQRRAAKQDKWRQLKNTILEGMAAVNRGAVDTVNFVGPDQVNAILQLSGSEKRVPTLNNIPGIDEATAGNYMQKGLPRDIVRTGGEFLSPL